MSWNLHTTKRGAKISPNKTRQGYARKRILKLAGYSFLEGRA